MKSSERSHEILCMSAAGPVPNSACNNETGVNEGCVLPGKGMCLRLHGTLVPLLPAQCLPEVHGSQLHMLPVETLSTSRLKALHDGMDVDVMPGCQHSSSDMLGKHGLEQTNQTCDTALHFPCLDVSLLVMLILFCTSAGYTCSGLTGAQWLEAQLWPTHRYSTVKTQRTLPTGWKFFEKQPTRTCPCLQSHCDLCMSMSPQVSSLHV